MKLHVIPKYQQGGGYESPYTPYRYFAVPQAAGNTVSPAEMEEPSIRKTTKDKDKGLANKDIMDLLGKLDGLPSDMAGITAQLQDFVIENAKNEALGGTNTASIEAKYLGILQQMRVAAFNKKEYETAYKQADQNESLNELAITDRGQFVCKHKNKDDYELLSAEELQKSDNYVALTNSELLYLRAHDYNLANSNKILSTVHAGVSMKTITDQVLKIINDMATDTMKTSGYAYTQKGRMVSGLEDFQKAVMEAYGTSHNGTVADLYKYTYLTKTQANHANEALSYIYHALPENAKALLKAKSDFTDQGAASILQTLVASTVDTTQEFDLTMHNQGNEGGRGRSSRGRSGSGDDNDGFKHTPLVQMVEGTGGVEQTMTVDRGDGVQMSVTGRKYNRITDTSESRKPIEATSIKNMLDQSGIADIVLDYRKITFGDQVLEDDTALSNIAYNGTGAERAILPKKADGTVDLSYMEEYLKLEKAIEALGKNPPEEKVRALRRESKLASLFLPSGAIDPTKFGLFLVTEGYTTDALSGVHESEFVKEKTKDTEKILDIIRRALTIGTGNDKESPQFDTYSAVNPFDWLGNYDHIYKAAMYIPIEGNLLAAASGDRQKLDNDTALTLDQRYEDFDKLLTATAPDADKLKLDKNNGEK